MRTQGCGEELFNEYAKEKTNVIYERTTNVNNIRGRKYEVETYEEIARELLK